jgi:hypothetical protein
MTLLTAAPGLNASLHMRFIRIGLVLVALGAIEVCGVKTAR